MKITKIVVDKLPIPMGQPGKTAQKRYYDQTLKGFGVRATSGGTKAFFVEKSINNKLRRMTIGRYGELTVEQARKEAQKLLGKIASGLDPAVDKQLAKAKAITLGAVFEDYKSARKNLKPKTLYDYTQIIQKVFSDWKDKSLFSISKDQISKKHIQ